MSTRVLIIVDDFIAYNVAEFYFKEVEIDYALVNSIVEAMELLASGAHFTHLLVHGPCVTITPVDRIMAAQETGASVPEYDELMSFPVGDEPRIYQHMTRFWQWIAREHPTVRQCWLYGWEEKVTETVYWGARPNTREGDYPPLIKWIRRGEKIFADALRRVRR